MRRAQSAAKGLEGKVTVGYLTHCQDAGFTDLAQEFERRFPACGLVTRDITGTDFNEVLRAGGVDVLLGRFSAQPPDDLVQGPVMSREDWVLGVGRGHPLADRDVVSVEELADYAIFGVPDPLTGVLHNPLYPVTTPKGRDIPRRGIARTFAEVLALVARCENVFPSGASFPDHYGHPQVVFVPLHGWPQATPNPRLARARQHRAGERLHRYRARRAAAGPAATREPRLRRLAWPPGPRLERIVRAAPRFDTSHS
jgi:hypothetical protein